MLVTNDNLQETLDDIEQTYVKGFDTETTGIRYHDRLFSIIISTPKDAYYFNFNDDVDHRGNPQGPTLHRSRTIAQLSSTFKSGIWAAHNAKFDLQKIYMEGYGCPKTIHCTLVSERLIRNDHLYYSLDEVAKLYGLEKDRTVDEYIMAHKLYTKISIPGKKKHIFEKHFNKVPFELMRKYGETDAKLARLIAEQQRIKLGL